jgi:acetyl esterase
LEAGVLLAPVGSLAGISPNLIAQEERLAMTLDPQAQAFLDLQAVLGLRPYSEMPLAEARAMFLSRDRHTPRQAVQRVEDRVIGPDSLTVRMYWPIGEVRCPSPALVYLHGGGWVFGGLDSVDVSCRAMANGAGMVVVSVEYGLAPEHKFPVPVEHCLSAWLWILAEGPSLGIDPARLAIGGDSAGGNLAIATTLLARDRSLPLPAFQLLVYPIADHNFETPSYHAFGSGRGLTTEMMRWYWDQYLPSPSSGSDPLASPLRADLRGLPPSYVALAECDPLASEGEALADRLATACVLVEKRIYPGQIHGFFHLGRIMDQGVVALNEAVGALKRMIRS